MKIRKANTKDCDDLVNELWKKLIKKHESMHQWFSLVDNASVMFREHLKSQINNEDGLVLVAEIEDELIGYTKAKIGERSPVHERSRIGEIDDIFVKEEYRRLNVGRRLVKKCHEWFKEKGIDLLSVDVLRVNGVGQSFWDSLGYTDYKVTKFKEL